MRSSARRDTGSADGAVAQCGTSKAGNGHELSSTGTCACASPPAPASSSRPASSYTRREAFAAAAAGCRGAGNATRAHCRRIAPTKSPAPGSYAADFHRSARSPLDRKLAQQPRDLKCNRNGALRPRGWSPTDVRGSEGNPKVLPQHPAGSRLLPTASVEVSIEVSVDATGVVSNAKPSSESSKIPASLSGRPAAARQWRFSPATLGGKPVSAEHTITFRFIRPNSGE